MIHGILNCLLSLHTYIRIEPSEMIYDFFFLPYLQSYMIRRLQCNNVSSINMGVVILPANFARVELCEYSPFAHCKSCRHAHYIFYGKADDPLVLLCLDIRSASSPLLHNRSIHPLSDTLPQLCFHTPFSPEVTCTFYSPPSKTRLAFSFP